MGKLVLVHDSAKPAESANSWDDAPYPQGYNFEVYRIWKLEEKYSSRYFKQLGTGDSYGVVLWSDADMEEVEQVEKVVKVYDYK